MLLPSSPRCRRQRRASLLVLAAFLLLIPVSASLPAWTGCPSRSVCQNQKRVNCKAGSECGPCLPSHEEAEDGRCVPRKLGKVKTFSDLEEEIDLIAKQEKIRKKPTKQKPVFLSVQRDREEGLTDTWKLKDRLLADVLLTSTEAPRHTTADLPNKTTLQSKVKGAIGHGGPHVVQTSKNDNIIIILVSVFVVMGTVAVIMAVACYVKLQTESRLAEKVDYPAFKGTGVSSAKTTATPMGDNTLAKSAQMYHYKHQKQQMISMGNNKPEQKPVDSEFTSDEEEVGGGFTVYECPGLAPTGEMEVKNPLFDDSTMEYQEKKK
ncbi:neural proliferation differentiation and control protein 1 isoform X1 [Oryzias latipes]|uniref:Neural proliferation, differentiation and control, 1a n=1 Tax=Oryzias latipes TaxID=8090 RepID=A0A3B3HTI4_ORYLA|nr:neural proliferation differentiation and control protein 1 isoform X1 [Oryzias latipes]